MMRTVQVRLFFSSIRQNSNCVRLVQYYKGAALLWHLEQNIVGSVAKFDEFLRSYIAKFARKILNTDDFIEFFEKSFPSSAKVDWKSWFYTPGMPPVTLDFSTELESKCRQLAEKTEAFRHDEIESLNPKQLAFLLNVLLNKKSPLSRQTIEEIDSNCQMSKYTNCEIRFRWFQLCIRSNYEKSLDEIFQFLKQIGRMKFVKPLYTEFKSSWNELMPRVWQFFQEQKRFMNPITAKQIELRLKD